MENRLHYCRDVSLEEDACQTRDFTCSQPSGSAQQHRIVPDGSGGRLVTRPLRYFDAHVQQTLALVLTGRCSVHLDWKDLESTSPP